MKRHLVITSLPDPGFWSFLCFCSHRQITSSAFLNVAAWLDAVWEASAQETLTQADVRDSADPPGASSSSISDAVAWHPVSWCAHGKLHTFLK